MNVNSPFIALLLMAVSASHVTAAEFHVIPKGYAPLVTLGGTAKSATVMLKNIPGLDTLKAEALHPGAESATPVKTEFKDGALTLTVPLKRGCAMVKLNAKQ